MGQSHSSADAVNVCGGSQSKSQKTTTNRHLEMHGLSSFPVIFTVCIYGTEIYVNMTGSMNLRNDLN